MQVLVTGGAGFIGSHCVDALLAKGHAVTVLDDFSSGREENLREARATAEKSGLKLKVLKKSISDPAVWAALEHHDAVLHFAAQTSVTASVSDPVKDFRSNVTPVPYMIEWVRREKVRSIVYANTAGALYGKAITFPTDERALIRPLSPYGATKSFFETYLFALNQSLKDSGVWSRQPADKNYLGWVSLRFANVYGPRQTPKGEAGVVPIFIEKMGAGQTPTIFGDGNKTRDYVHVRDLTDAVMLALEKLQHAALDETMNIATGVETRDVEVFQLVMKNMHEIGADPESHEKFRNSLKISAPQFAPVRPGEVIRSIMDIQKAQVFLGWKPKIGFIQGIQETVQGYFS